MTRTGINPTFTAALREDLVAEVNKTTRPPLTKRRYRWIGAGIVLVLAIGGGAGVAAATGAFTTPPGRPIVADVMPAVSGTFAGSAVIDIGAAPEDATGIRVSFTCLSEGTFTSPEWGGTTCDAAAVGQMSETPVSRPLPIPESGTVTTETAPEARWAMTIAFVRATTTDWAVNESGQTFGVINEAGEPDLIAAMATNGKQGYVDRTDLAEANGSAAAATFDSPEDAAEWAANEGRDDHAIVVYESDGETVIGEFVVLGSDSQNR